MRTSRTSRTSASSKTQFCYGWLIAKQGASKMRPKQFKTTPTVHPIPLETLEKLTELGNILRSKCHTSKCRDISLCPERCKCRRQRNEDTQLDLHTAMMWNAGQMILTTTWKEITIDECLQRIVAYKKILLMHKEKYKNTTRAIVLAGRALFALRPTLETPGIYNSVIKKLRSIKRSSK